MTEELTNDAGLGLWLACVEQLSQDLPEQQFNTWIKPLTAVVAEDFSKVTVYVANRFKLDWIRAQYAARIAGLLEDLYGQPVTLELALAQREGVTRTYVRPYQAERSTPAEVPTLLPANAAPEESAAPAFRTRLNSALTFETLVEGTANRMARSAAMHVAASPGHLYNPLFIYGVWVWVKPTWYMLWATSCWKTVRMPRFSTSTLNNLSRMWSRLTSAAPLMSSRSAITRSIFVDRRRTVFRQQRPYAGRVL